jgi:hypothetical protein
VKDQLATEPGTGAVVLLEPGGRVIVNNLLCSTGKRHDLPAIYLVSSAPLTSVDTVSVGVVYPVTLIEELNTTSQDHPYLPAMGAVNRLIRDSYNRRVRSSPEQ